MRYYSLYLEWGDGEFNHAGFLEDFHYFIGNLGRGFDSRIDTIYNYMNNFKYKCSKLKPEIIQQILEYEEKNHTKIGGDYYIISKPKTNKVSEADK